MVDVNKAIRLAVDTGDVKLGSRDAVKAALNGEAKLIILAENCPPSTKSDIEGHATMSKVPFYSFKGTSVELGSLCGKPFPVSAMSVFDGGNSSILELGETEKK